MLADVTTILREHRLALPADLALLIKAFISLEGMGRGLDPGFHMAAEALPLLRQVLRARYQPKALAQRSWRSLRNALVDLLDQRARRPGAPAAQRAPRPRAGAHRHRAPAARRRPARPRRQPPDAGAW